MKPYFPEEKGLPGSINVPSMPVPPERPSIQNARACFIEAADAYMKRRRNQVRDALQRTKDVGKLEKIAEILGV
jgi:hypothetical protein